MNASVRKGNYPVIDRDWEASGGKCCPECGEETVRLREITPGHWACPRCYIKYCEDFSEMETSLEPLLNSDDPKLARMAKRQLMQRAPS